MAVSNISVILYVLAMLYTILFVIAVWRTYKQVFKDKPYPNYRVFKAFYVILWVQLLLTAVLNWVLALKLYNTGEQATKEETLEVILFVYAPTIMMVISYTLLYYQMIHMFMLSRIRTAQRFHSRFASQRLEKVFKILTIFIMCLFLITQAVLLTIAFFGTVSEIKFEIQLGVFVICIILIMNFNMVIQYFKHSGMPYKNDKLYKKVKYFGTVAGVWSVAFLIKFGFGIYGTKAYKESNEDTLSTAIAIAAGAILCDMVPYLAIIDSKFIKIYSMAHLKDVVNKSSGQITENDLESSVTERIDTNGNQEIADDSALALITSDDVNQNLLSNKVSINSESQDNGTILGKVSGDLTQSELTNNQTKKFRLKDYLHVSKRGPITETQIENGRIQLESKIMIEEETDLQVSEVFSLPWYQAGEKQRKNKLGSLNMCVINKVSNEEKGEDNKNAEYITRTMNFDRISSYQIDGYLNELTRMYLLKLKPWMVFPKAIHIDQQMSINVAMKKQVSLYQFIHDRDNLDPEMKEELQLSYGLKLHICIEIAKIINTFHYMQPPIVHGHLTPHNIFIRLQDGDLRLRIGDTELIDLQKYANMFYSYRAVSVYSAPECLKAQKKILDKVTQMDIYSLGMIFWELWHESTPFENDIKDASNFVVKEEARPAIQADKPVGEESDDDDDDSSEEEKPPAACTHNMAELIRICWQQNASLRPDIIKVCSLLHTELQASAAIDSDDEDDENNSIESA